MLASKEPPRPSRSHVNQPSKERPPYLAAAMAHGSPKRLKYSSPELFVDPPQDKIPQRASASSQASIPSNSTSRGRAEAWFDDTNEHPTDVPFVDNDPPYYLKSQAPDDNGVGATQSESSFNQKYKPRPTAPTRSLLAQMNANGNNGEDYRSVIDDLTIQNKKLKKKLRKYEVLHCSHLQEEKLFEVRIHGLAANRKHELEETLWSFASSIDEDSPHRPLPGNIEPPTHLKPAPLLYKPASSSTSTSKPHLDSAYASMSGQTGVASQTHPVDQKVQEKPLQANRLNTNSSLQGITEALAPSSSDVMSDQSKSKTVVRRLEQLFTGNAAAPPPHGQFLQQHEVPLLASVANGQRPGQEGPREAHILSADAELQVDSMVNMKTQASNHGSNPQSFQASHGGSPRSPEQRPTRPLDLDIHRAQIPADNMDYIRHLGLSSSIEDAVEGPAMKDGWVYLNLLTGMAQLHTLNATPEFIRKAVRNFSSRLELSSDQTKVRWLGGSTGTRLSSDDDQSEEPLSAKPSGSSLVWSSRASRVSRDEAQELLPCRVNRSENLPATAQIDAKRQTMNHTEVRNEVEDVQYKPLFFHAAVSDDEVLDGDSDSTEPLDSPNVTAVTGINSGASTLPNRVTRLRGPRKKDGPMIFYNRAKFCTDLSGNLDGASRKQCTYRRITKYPIGKPDLQMHGSDESDLEQRESFTEEMPASQDDDVNATRSILDLDDLSSVISDHASGTSVPLDPMEMEASGLGGTQPEDNFVVRVGVRHGNRKMVSRKASSKSKGHVAKVLRNVETSPLDTFRKTREIPRSNGKEDSFFGEIVFSVRTDMAPSALPPPSFACPALSLSGSDDGRGETDEDAGMSSAGSADCNGAPAISKIVRPSPKATQRQMSRYSSPTTPSEDGDDGSDDSSIDLLAHARGLDPETIAAREREFESNTGDLAEVPAGSSAATVGGGSERVNSRYVDGDQSDINSMSVDGDQSDDSNGAGIYGI